MKKIRVKKVYQLGSIGTLDRNLDNPTSSSFGAFGADVLALRDFVNLTILNPAPLAEESSQSDLRALPGANNFAAG